MSKKKLIRIRAVLGTLLMCIVLFFSARAGAYEIVYVTAPNLLPHTASYAEHAYLTVEQFNPVASQYSADLRPRPSLAPLSAEYIEQLSNFSYLTRNIFLVDPRTRLYETDICVPTFLEKDLTIDTSLDGPLVLIFHAHSMEDFIDSDPNDYMTRVMGVGRALAEILEARHGIQTIHYMGRFDVLNGVPHRPGSYERMEPVIRQILADNPSVQMVIDLHRDGVGPHVPPMVTYIDGKRTAQIMFVNGLSRQHRHGVTTPVPWLPNPYQQENLAFSMRLQLAANQLYPGIARRVYLLPFRYSLHMAPLSVLLEVGAQNNTFQEAVNAMGPVADIIAAVVLDGH